MVPETEDLLPIDIDHSKLLTWLLDRRHLPKNWHASLKSTRELVHQALKTTPQAALSALNIKPPAPLDPPISYFRVLDILSALTVPDAPAEWQAGPDKDILGWYKGPTARAWQTAVSNFEKNGIFLADCAQTLVRNADIEAKTIRSTITSLQKEITELTRKDPIVVQSSAEATKRFESACEEFELEVDGVADYYNALKDAVQLKVPLVLKEAVEIVKEGTLADVITYYSKFVAYVNGKNNAGKDLCKTLRVVIDGDIEQFVQTQMVLDEHLPEPRIGWEIDVSKEPAVTTEETSAEVDWGIEIESENTLSIEKTVEEAGKSSEELNDATGIDWNEIPKVSQNVVESGEVGNKGGQGPTLADAKFRGQYLNDLIELDAFLCQREEELSRSGNSEVRLVLQQAPSTPEFVKAVDLDRISEFKHVVNKAINSINSSQTRRILSLQSDRKRLERVAKSIAGKKHVSERMHASIDVLRERRRRAITALSLEAPKFEELGKQTRDIKKRTEKALSGMYKGRAVHILGEINNIFPPE